VLVIDTFYEEGGRVKEKGRGNVVSECRPSFILTIKTNVICGKIVPVRNMHKGKGWSTKTMLYCWKEAPHR